MKYLLLALAISTPAMAYERIINVQPQGIFHVNISAIAPVINKVGDTVLVTTIRARGLADLPDADLSVGVVGCGRATGVVYIQELGTEAPVTPLRWFKDSNKMPSVVAQVVCARK